MTVRKVPEDYSTISAAVSAASAGDEIIINGGTYTENISGIPSNVTIKSKWGTRATITGNITLSSGSVLYGIDSTCSSGNNISCTGGTTSLRLTDCTITNTGTGYGLNFGSVSGVATTFMITRCIFTNNSGSSNRAIWLGAIPDAIIAGCVFINWRTTSTGTVRSANSSDVNIYNCVFYNCDVTGGSGYVVRMESSGTKKIYNCIFQNCNVTASALVLQSVSGHVIGYCCHYNNSTATLRSGGTDDGNHITSDPLFDTTTYLLQEGSPCIAVGDYTNSARKDIHGRAFSTTTPDIGAAQTLSGAAWAIYAKRKYIDPGYGITLTISGQTAATNGDKISFDTPWEIAEYLEYSWMDYTSVAIGTIEVLWHTSNAFQVRTYTDSMSYTFTELSLFGEDTSVGTLDTGLLSGDTNFYIFSTELDEETQGNYKEHQIYKTDYGHVIGYDYPDDVHNIVFTFSGISETDPLFPEYYESTLRDIITQFYSGTELRVYRAFPENLDIYSENTTASNLEGYTDIIRTERMDGYKWQDVVLGRFAFTVEGISTETTHGLTGAY